MKAVHKYKLNIADSNEIEMPQDAKILSIRTQDEDIYMWVLVDTEVEVKEERTFILFETGHKINKDKNVKLEYISTVQLSGGALVFHVFEHSYIF